MYVKPLVITGVERGNMLTPSALISTETEDGQAVVRKKGTQQNIPKWQLSFYNPSFFNLSGKNFAYIKTVMEMHLPTKLQTIILSYFQN